MKVLHYLCSNKHNKMDNASMKPNRFMRWQTAKNKLSFIDTHLSNGLTVYIQTSMKIWKLTPKAKFRPEMKATKSGLYMQNGNGFICIDGCKISAQ